MANRKPLCGISRKNWRNECIGHRDESGRIRSRPCRQIGDSIHSYLCFERTAKICMGRYILEIRFLHPYRHEIVRIVYINRTVKVSM